MAEPVRLKVAEALSKDVGRGNARMDPAEFDRLAVKIGDIVQIAGEKGEAVARVMPAYPDMRGQGVIQLDGITRANAGLGLGDKVRVGPVPWQPADKVTLAPTTVTPRAKDMEYIGSLLDGLPVRQGDLIRVSLFASRSADFRVEKVTPGGTVVIHPTTSLLVGQAANAGADSQQRLSYEDVGGLRRQVNRIREMIELPLRYPEAFARLGIDPPKGVLMHGPPGCGKTLIARIIAQETDARFFSVSGPEVVHKFYGESEAHLRKIFEEAGRKGPSIIFLDEIDAIAPHREKVVGDVEKRVVAQLLALMDGLNRRTNVIVIAATNLPNNLDPALRRPGRFDREIRIPIPDRDGRRDILDIHSRGMPLAANVDIAHLADMTHGFVGADLEALCREAAMGALRKLLPEIDFNLAELPIRQLMQMYVTMEDFLDALHEIEPSAIREVFVEIPNVGWGDIGGLGEVKRRLMEAVEWPLNYPELFEHAGVKAPKGLLLGGPPGVGKTLIAKAVANESGVNVISVKGPALMSRYVGESERGVREVFQVARQAAPCIIFLDEVDALIPARSAAGADSHVSARVLSQFLAEMDGLEELQGVFVLGATNRTDLIDPAMLRPGRFDEVVEIPLPDYDDRKAILAVHMRNKPLAQGITVEPLAQRTEGASGAELAAICNRAALAAIRRAIEQSTANHAEKTGGPMEDVRILPEDFEEALAAVLPAAAGSQGGHSC